MVQIILHFDHSQKLRSFFSFNHLIHIFEMRSFRLCGHANLPELFQAYWSSMISRADIMASVGLSERKFLRYAKAYRRGAL